MFKKKRSPSSQASMTSAASYLAAVSQADACARAQKDSPTSTPALSLSSSITVSTEDSVLRDHDSELDGPLSLSRVPPNSEQVFSTVHSEFGHCANEEYRHTSAHRPGKDVGLPVEIEPPYYIVLTTYFSYLILICMGHMRDFFGKRFYASNYRHLLPHDVSIFSVSSTSPPSAALILSLWPFASLHRSVLLTYHMHRDTHR